MSTSSKGMAFGLLAVIAFSFTLPATRLAVAAFDPVAVGLGRAVVAAFPAAFLLLLTKQRRPDASQWRRLAIVALGVIVGFPVCSAWAMQRVDASHGAVVLGILPLATAVAAFLRAGERPGLRFWLASIAGSATVVAFSLSSGSGSLSPADGALLLAVMLAAMGYAEGGRLAREIGGWQVICWSLVLAFPVIVGPLIWLARDHGMVAPASAWVGFAYLSFVSAFLGFFAWYHGLALGGVARVGQLQLLQPFFTFIAAATFLGERFGWKPVACAALVGLFILAGRRAPLRRSPAASAVPVVT
ncbi:DMT family transporter [Luteolibacter sp. Populi]|uniref:DMT family transporter n=1 Tax=Luteolibacter sp. Populi TaxID=3230487 RepID=UPI0034679F5A